MSAATPTTEGNFALLKDLTGQVDRVPDSELKGDPLFLLTLSANAGDFLHTAAAAVLARHELKSPAKKHPYQTRPVVVCMLDFRGPQRGRSYGQTAFDLCDKLGVPCMMAVLNTKEDIGARDDYVKFFTYPKVLDLWKKQQAAKAQRASKKEKEPSYDELFQAVDQVILPDPRTQYTDGTFLATYTHATAMIMQLVKHFGSHLAQTIMGERLVHPTMGFDAQALFKFDPKAPPDINDKYRRDALLRFITLVGVIRSAKARQKADKVLLLNYRRAYYYLQHNGTTAMLTQIKELTAKSNTAVVIIPAMFKEFYEGNIDSNNDDIFYLYDNPNIPNPYSNSLPNEGRAYFWNLVARYLQVPPKEISRKDEFVKNGDACVIGMLGGRSGSMDIASFAGMRCMSWDEPIFCAINDATAYLKDGLPPGSKPEPPSEKSFGASPWPPQWASSQAHQVLRLLNQRDIMHTCFLDSLTMTSVIDPLSGSKERQYEKLKNSIMLDNFLNASNISVTEKPWVSLGSPAFLRWTMYIIDLSKKLIERPSIGIIATNVYAYRLLADWELQGEKEAEKAINDLPLTNNYAPDTKYPGK